ncbi:MAG: hypothetical protein V3S11_04155 [Elusimicrobiota bacterium]
MKRGNGLCVLLACLLIPGSAAADFALPTPAEVLGAADSEPPKIEESGPTPEMMVELRMEAFKGEGTPETRANVEHFVKTLGRVMTSYQDNEQVRHIDVESKDSEKGPIASVKRFFLMREARSVLEADARVESVREDSRGGLGAFLKPPLYPEQVEDLGSKLPERVGVSYYRNAAMEGIWINLAFKDKEDPREAARAFAEAHPREVAWAKAMVSIPVMKIQTGGSQ